MKIAIAVNEKNENVKISENAGRAKFFMIFENEKLIDTIENPFRMGSGGAGFGVAKMFGDKGVEKIVAGKFGENFVGAMKERNISFEEKVCTVKDFFEEWMLMKNLTINTAIKQTLRNIKMTLPMLFE